jgi:CBS-domain-containing membrane protein
VLALSIVRKRDLNNAESDVTTMRQERIASYLPGTNERVIKTAEKPQLRKFEPCTHPGASSMRHKTKKTINSVAASELYRPSDRRLSAKLVPTFADIGCHVVSVTDPYGRILGFLDRFDEV